MPPIARTLLDPPQNSPLGAASQWVELLTAGNLAAVVATIAIAIVGFLMFGGRVDVRCGTLTLLGCFVIFGAPAIAVAVRSLGGDTEMPEVLPPSIPSSFAPPTNASGSTPYDPYAGAAVPR
jgi:type IV secretory pathway VirB2 component (pilin)